jgi:hypothetical protein
MSLGRTTFERREFRRPANAFDLDADHLAEAGVADDLNTFWCEGSDVGVAERAEEKDSSFEEILVDSPTQPGTLTGSTMPGNSNPGVSPRPAESGFQESLNCDGEPMAEDDTVAPDSEEAESTGGCSWNECDIE